MCLCLCGLVLGSCLWIIWWYGLVDWWWWFVVLRCLVVGSVAALVGLQ